MNRRVKLLALSGVVLCALLAIGTAVLVTLFAVSRSFPAHASEGAEGWSPTLANAATNGNLYQYITVPTTTDRDRATGIAISPTGSQYVVGLFTGELSYSGTSGVTSSSASNYDIYVAHLKAGGVTIWVRAVATASAWGFPPEVVCDESGAYVVGHMIGSVTFGSITLVSSVDTAFIAKISSSGVWSWAELVVADDITFGRDIDIYANDLYVTFSTRARRVTVGTTTLGWSDSALRPVVARFGTSGAFDWALGVTHTTEDASARGVAYDSVGGRVCIAGQFRGVITFNTTSLVSNVGDDAFVACIAPGNDTWTWATAATNTGSNFRANSVKTDENGLYVTGLYDETATFGNTNVTSVGGNDIFVAKISNDGEWQWALSAGGSLNDYASSIVVGFSVAYITGSLRATATFGQIAHTTNSGAEDVYVAAINASVGAWKWLSTSEATGGYAAEGMGLAINTAVLTNGEPALSFCGFFKGRIKFKYATYTAANEQDSFVGRLRVDHL